MQRSKRTTSKALPFLVASLLGLIGCSESSPGPFSASPAAGNSAGPSKEDFEAFIAEHNHCQEHVECTVFSPGCPLGCGAAVRVDAADAAQSLANEALEAYRANAQFCMYMCVGHQSSECANGRCRLCTQSAGGSNTTCLPPTE